MALLDPFLDLFRRKPSPFASDGGPGVAVYGGYVDEGETNPKLIGEERYRTYATLLANTTIVAASVRYALNLIAKAEWTVGPADDSDEAARIAEWFDRQIHGMETPWHRVVRRSALYRYHGFSLAEWSARREDDGSIGISDVRSRPQHTIEQWAIAKDGTVEGVVQRSPQTFERIPLARAKLVYLVDDSITDSPEGLGLFRHVVQASERLAEYERLEGIGFETDLRGVPVARAPIGSMNRAVAAGVMQPEMRDAQLLAIRTFLTKHKRTANLSLLLDSQPYESTGDSRSPSSTPQWSIELMKAGATSAPEMAAAIQRLNREMARVLGTENILLGEDGSGSLAMSRDKSDQFALVVDSSLKEMREVFQRDLIRPFMELNGWDLALEPQLTVEKLQHRSVEEVTTALRDLALAFGPGSPDDEAINSVRVMLGLPELDLEQIALDAELDAERERLVAERPRTTPNDPEPETPDRDTALDEPQQQ